MTDIAASEEGFAVGGDDVGVGVAVGATGVGVGRGVAVTTITTDVGVAAGAQPPTKSNAINGTPIIKDSNF